MLHEFSASFPIDSSAVINYWNYNLVMLICIQNFIDLFIQETFILLITVIGTVATVFKNVDKFKHFWAIITFFTNLEPVDKAIFYNSGSWQSALYELTVN